MLEGIAASESQDRVDAVRGKAACGGCNVSRPAVHDRIRPQPPCEGEALIRCCSRQHSHAAKFRKLDRKRADTAGGTVNDQCFPSLHLQHIVDTLKRRESADCKNACFSETHSLRDVSDPLCFRRGVFGVEAAAARTVNLIAHPEAAHAGSERDDCS